MNNDVRALFKEALIKSLEVISPLVGQYTEPYLKWIQVQNGWSGQTINQPDWVHIGMATDKVVENICADFITTFKRQYPEYVTLVGFRGLGSLNITMDSSYVVRAAIIELWKRHGTLELSEADIEAIVQEFADFMDRPSVKIRFTAVLANFRVEGRTIRLPRNIAIRRMSGNEISEIYGGYVRQMGYMPRPGPRMDEYVVEGEFEATKVLGEPQDDGTPPPHQYRTDLDRAILVLRTFKGGIVGYDWIRFHIQKFYPVDLPMYGSTSNTPFGRYNVLEAEIEPLEQHARKIFATSEAAMELACSRLADAETRLSPRDRLLDAVIGLEALLLAGIPRDDRRGELRFRFSLNYSTLFSEPEDRRKAFRTARDLYDLRSAIAHGGTVNEEKFRVGDEQLDFGAAARKACEVLRGVIHHFLLEASGDPYKDPQYWEKQYFGLEDD